jgi:hypothetical protein
VTGIAKTKTPGPLKAPQQGKNYLYRWQGYQDSGDMGGLEKQKRRACLSRR